MRYKQKPVTSGVTRFTKAPMGSIEFSRMQVAPYRYTTFNAGEIVPIYYAEILPHDTFTVNIDYVVRQTTSLRPTMGDLDIDIYAFWVPNRIVNESWKNVQGENTSGFWTAPEVDLAPLYTGESDVSIPPESVADYYGFPTQAPLKAVHLQQANDIKFRDYLEIYNVYFRDENFEACIPYSKLNVYNGFLHDMGTRINATEKTNEGYGTTTQPSYASVEDGGGQGTDGSYPFGAINKALFGDGAPDEYGTNAMGYRLTQFSALERPLRANKFHDPFTSVLPAPQKGAEVVFGVAETAPVVIDTESNTTEFPSGLPLDLVSNGNMTVGQFYNLVGSATTTKRLNLQYQTATGTEAPLQTVSGTNLKAYTDLSQATGVSVNDLRIAVATQHVYEALARGGSRYQEMLRSFFEIETETPFSDIPIQLGHIRNVLDMYQVAQTSSSEAGGNPQGHLTAYGYTTKGGKLFHRTFLEHGYVHVLAVVRQKNLYTTYLAPDNFRRKTLDFYLPQLANIGEQPIPLRTLNPFISGHDDAVIGYQEAWWEYRYEPDACSGYFRDGVPGSLVGWTYADKYDPNFTHVNANWLKSNAREVVDSTLAVTSAMASQFIGQFAFSVDKQRPMPVYSVPGLDDI